MGPSPHLPHVRAPGVLRFVAESPRHRPLQSFATPRGRYTQFMVTKKRKQRRSFTPEYKAEVVRLVAAGDRTAGQVARDLELTETSVRAWVRQSDKAVSPA